MSSHRDKPASLGSLLATSRDAAARHAGTAIDREQWRRIVGERIAARTEPGPKRGRELTVYAASASWAQELSLLVNEIVTRIKAAGFGVDTVRFAVRELKARTRAAAPKPAVRRVTLPSALHAQLSGIADTELRDAIAEAASLWLARDEPPLPAPRAASQSPPPTSARPSARSPRDVESQSAHLDRKPSPGRGATRGKL